MTESNLILKKVGEEKQRTEEEQEKKQGKKPESRYLVLKITGQERGM